MNAPALHAPAATPGIRLPLLIAILVITPLLSFLLWKVYPHIDDENNLLEWAQALCLALACYMHGKRALSANRASLAFVIHAGMCWLMFAFLLRELDIDKFGAAHAWKITENIFRIIEALLLAALLIFMAPRLKTILAHAALIFKMPATWLSIAGAAFMVAGWPFDKRVFPSVPQEYSLLMEELLELNAYILLYAASLADSSPALAVDVLPVKAVVGASLDG